MREKSEVQGLIGSTVQMGRAVSCISTQPVLQLLNSLQLLSEITFIVPLVSALHALPHQHHECYLWKLALCQRSMHEHFSVPYYAKHRLSCSCLPGFPLFQKALNYGMRTPLQSISGIKALCKTKMIWKCSFFFLLQVT